jgi:hypothetical protein
MEYISKAIIYKDFEDLFGPCGCGMGMATYAVLMPRHWLIEEYPDEVADHEFCRGFDYRRVSNFSCNNVFEHTIKGTEFLSNYSCCKECADRAVKCGYAVWAKKEYPMILR